MIQQEDNDDGIDLNSVAMDNVAQDCGFPNQDIMIGYLEIDSRMEEIGFRKDNRSLYYYALGLMPTAFDQCD
ncbi:hypothetical protein MBANPS3_010896 [Mucor bainieri]